MDDPYKLLNVPSNASQDDIRRAYRTLAKQHHPDLNPGNLQAEDRFKAVSAAHELLSDPEKRARYDRGEIDAAGQERAPQSSYRDYAESAAGHRYRRAGPESGGWNEQELHDLFGSMFDEAQSSGHQHPRRGRDEHYVLTAGFLEAINGTTTRLTLPSGRVLDVKIPAGTDNGRVLRLRGQGSAGAVGGVNGDALIEIRVASHLIFKRTGQDIRLELPVTLAEAVLGGQVEVPTPAGPVRMRVPAHSDNATELRLKGRGVPAHDGLAAGDLYATLRIVIGAQDSSLEEFLRSWNPDNPPNPRQSMEAHT